MILVSIVTSYAFLRADVVQNTRNYAKLEERVECTDTLLVTIQVTLAEIQRDILYIRERLAQD